MKEAPTPRQKNDTSDNTPVISVTAIKEGTVIDHIQAGNAVVLLQLLKVDTLGLRVSVGLHVSSTTMGCKDIIKVEKFKLTPSLAAQMAIFAPKASVSIIENYQVVDKFHTALPSTIDHIIFCPNTNCITNHENCRRKFFVNTYKCDIQLHCKHCENNFNLKAINRFAL